MSHPKYDIFKGLIYKLIVESGEQVNRDDNNEFQKKKNKKKTLLVKF